MQKLTLDLSEIDGNAFVILGKARVTMKKGGINTDIIEKFTKEAIRRLRPFTSNCYGIF